MANPMTKPLDTTQQAALFSAARTPRDRAILAVFYATGVRVGELVALNVSDIDARGLCVRIIHEKEGLRRRPKRRRSMLSRVFKRKKPRKEPEPKTRTVNITVDALRVVAAYIRGRGDRSGPLFWGHRGRRISISGVRALVKRLGDSAGIPGMHSHLMRHSFATRMVEKGVAAPALQIMLGHTTMSTTMAYYHASAADVKAEYRRAMQEKV